MANLNRVFQKIFGDTATVPEIGVFGSFAAGVPTTTKDPAVIQSLPNWEQAWYGAVLGNNSPCIEDMNGVMYVLSYQLAYLLQKGIAEWNSETEYHIGSIINAGGILLVSLQDDNVNNSVTDSDWWAPAGRSSESRYTSPIVIDPAVGIVTNPGADEDMYVAAPFTYAGWTGHNSAASQVWNSIDWSPTLKLFCAISADGTNHIQTSPDGITWTIRTLASSAWQTVHWSERFNMFMASGAALTNNYAYSFDGINWTTGTITASQGNGIASSSTLNIAVLVCSDTLSATQIMSSVDGVTWTARTKPAGSNAWESVTWSEGEGKFVAVGSSGTSLVMTSVDGINWVAGTASAASAWKSVCWAENQSKFVAVASSGTDRVMTSSDGITWTSRTAASASAWNAVAYSPDLGLFMAVSDTSMSSPDGITWTSRAIPSANIYKGICWAPELSLFASCASSGLKDVMTTPFVGTTNITANPQMDAGIFDGETKRLIGVTNYAYNYVRVRSLNGVKLKSDVPWVSSNNSILTLREDLARDLWVEASRA